MRASRIELKSSYLGNWFGTKIGWILFWSSTNSTETRILEKLWLLTDFLSKDFSLWRRYQVPGTIYYQVPGYQVLRRSLRGGVHYYLLLVRSPSAHLPTGFFVSEFIAVKNLVFVRDNMWWLIKTLITISWYHNCIWSFTSLIYKAILSSMIYSIIFISIISLIYLSIWYEVIFA